METFLPLPDAAAAAHITPDELIRMVASGKIKPAMLSTGVLLVNQRDLPIRREDTPEYKAVAHLRGIGIGVRQAGEKYNVKSPTISQWVEKNLIRRLSGEVLRGQRVLLDEADVAYCAAVYHQNPGQGKRIFNSDGTPYRK